MKNLNLPQSDGVGEPEIYRLLKIGSFTAASDSKLDAPETQPAQPATPAKSQIIKKNVKANLQKAKNSIRPYIGWLFYPAVFAISFCVFYFTMNFPSLMAQADGWFGSNKSQDEQLLGDELLAYNAWMNGYFYAVSDRDKLAPSNDYDHDGLTNQDEFIMRTNPTIGDSDTDGVSDGVEVLNLGNAWGRGDMTREQKKLREKLNVILLSERISYSASANHNQAAPTDESKNFDTVRHGTLSIPKLKLQVPLVFSKDVADFDKDLEKGVIHYPGTSLPGQKGVMYVSGHSSDYIWKRNPYAYVFTKLNHLTAGDDIYVNVYDKDGKLYTYRYRVTKSSVYSPDDQTQFIDNTSSKLNLSTCWPIGTQKDRLVVTAELTDL